jgi:hypothetical protein
LLQLRSWQDHSCAPLQPHDPVIFVTDIFSQLMVCWNTDSPHPIYKVPFHDIKIVAYPECEDDYGLRVLCKFNSKRYVRQILQVDQSPSPSDVAAVSLRLQLSE